MGGIDANLHPCQKDPSDKIICLHVLQVLFSRKIKFIRERKREREKQMKNPLSKENKFIRDRVRKREQNKKDEEPALEKRSSFICHF